MITVVIKNQSLYGPEGPRKHFTMPIVTHFHTRLTGLGIACNIVGGELHIQGSAHIVRVRFDDEWREGFRRYKSARSISFNADTRTLVHNNSVELQVTRLGQTPLLAADEYELKDRQDNCVEVGSASHAFALSFFDSGEYEKHFTARIKRRILESRIVIRRVQHLLLLPTTATYTHKGRKTPSDLENRAIASVRRSLFKIAVEQHDCLTVWKPRKRRMKSVYLEDQAADTLIPRADYDENVVSFYKVAKASPFPSQSFLAYYHVLEYFFLRVSELLLHDHLTALINAPSFSANRSGLDKVISAVRGQDSRSDETEMLRNVLERFVPEPDLIDFLAAFEETCGEKIYTKRRQVFGEQMQITPQKDHALANAAKVLKHVRNAIVHSSDRYKREDCHIPLSETEDVIEEFIPLVRFLAERIIFGTAS